MPKKNGREALQEIKAHPVLRTIPVVILTTSQAEKLLRDSESRYRSFVTHAPVIICELLPDGTISYVNPAVQKIAGYLSEDLKGVF